ncbi:MAG: GH116 family glycosyl hydrolase [Candidatus Latescibacterota bacterium]
MRRTGAPGEQGMGTAYSKRELAGRGRQRTFRGDHLQQIAFPLGGLGAGCLHLGGAGNFQDFCLFNRPSFGHSPMTFAAVHCTQDGAAQGVMRVLEGPVQLPHIYNQARYGNGGLSSGHEGLPHMRRAVFRGEFPFAWVDLQDPALPLKVRLEAYSPLVPRDERASGLPAAFLSYRLQSTTLRPVRLQVSFNIQYPTPADLHGHDASDLQGHRVRLRSEDGISGLYFDSDLPAGDVRKMSLAVVSPLSGQRANCAWFRGGWFDALTVLAGQLMAGRLESHGESRPVLPGRARFGATLFWDLQLGPGQQVDVPLIYCWHAPNTDLQYGRLEPRACCEDGCGAQEGDAGSTTYRPYYSTLYEDAWAVARWALVHGDELRQRTRRFHRALFRSSLPDYALDAVSANLAILKSPTLLRQQDGYLWNWEGCSYGQGCCAGSCTHVWNYAQAVPYLFPSLERTLRDQEMKHSMDERGHVTFRSALPTGPVAHTFHAAADGQLGGILKVYREWLISGDDDWLAERYPLVRRSLEYCIATWDPERQGVLREPHHNTYDIEFWGPDVMCTSFYLGALQAMGCMAEHLGEADDARRYRELAGRGQAYCDARLWNGGYYVQQVEWRQTQASRDMERWTGSYSEEALVLLEREGPKYQYGKGCLSDGVIGQWYATMLGLPDALSRDRARQHLAAVFAHNFRRSLAGHANPQRPGYALNDEPGLLLCSWPRQDKPSLPFPYSDEVWTGIEYQVASHMIYEGMVAEGLSVVKAVRQRYDGRVRNPWNEYECGSYYARALSSYAVLLALSGFRYTAAHGRLDLAPQQGRPAGRFLFSVESGWGSVEYEKRPDSVVVRVRVEEGSLLLRQVVFGGLLVDRPCSQRMATPLTARPGRPAAVVLQRRGDVAGTGSDAAAEGRASG